MFALSFSKKGITSVVNYFLSEKSFNTLLLGGFLANNRSVTTVFCHVCFNLCTKKAKHNTNKHTTFIVLL